MALCDLCANLRALCVKILEVILKLILIKLQHTPAKKNQGIVCASKANSCRFKDNIFPPGISHAATTYTKSDGALSILAADKCIAARQH